MLLPAPVAAGPACPGELFPQDLPPIKEDRLRELERLAVYTDVCLDRADYYAYVGALLVSLGRGAQAIEPLERALMLAPDMAGVQFDYAQALAQGGERKSASALLQLLMERQDLHPDFRSFLNQQESTLLQPHWLYNFRLTSQFGRETNLNSAPSGRFFTFTPASGQVVLELDSSSLKRGGLGWLNHFSATAATDLGRGEAVYVLGDARYRQSGGGTDYLIGEASVIYRGPRVNVLPGAGQHANIKFGLSQLDFGGRTLFQGSRVEAGLDLPIGSCQGRGGLARETRAFPGATVNDGEYIGIVVSAYCLINNNLFNLQLNTGVDRPDNSERPGGRQRRDELALGWVRDYDRFGLQLIGAYTAARDAQGYSPLIESGETRRLGRYLVRGELKIPITRTLQWVANLETSRQMSNLSLFDVSSQAVYFGIRARFN